MGLLEGLEGIFRTPPPTKESVAYTRYADELSEESSKHIYQFPRGQPYRRINNSQLFKIQKTPDHWENLKRSKSYIADKFFAPFDLKEGNLRELLIT